MLAFALLSALCICLCASGTAGTPRVVRETIDDDDGPPNFANDDSDDFSDVAVTIFAIVVLIFVVPIMLVMVSLMAAHPDDTVAQTIDSPIDSIIVSQLAVRPTHLRSTRSVFTF